MSLASALLRAPAGSIVSDASIAANPAPSASIDVDPVFANDITDDTTAILNWIASVDPAAGADIQLPPGSMLTSAEIALTGRPGITMRGRGTTASVLKAKTAYTGAVIKCSNTWANRLKNIRIDSQTQRTAGTGIVVEGGNSSVPLSGSYPLNANQMVIEDVDMDNMFNCLSVINAAAPLSTPWILDINRGRWHHDGGTGLDLNATTAPGAASFGASHRFSNLFLYANPLSIASGAAYRIRGTGDARFTNCDSFGTYEALVMDPGPAGWVTTCRFTNCFFDSALKSVARLAPDAAVTTFGDIAFNSTWFASSGQEHGLYLATAKASNVRAVNCIFINNNIFGVVLAAACKNNDFTGCVFSSNATGGFIATGAATRFKITDCRGLGNYGVGPATAQPLGGQIDLLCTDYIIALNDLSQCATPLTDNGGVVNKYVAGNI